MSWINYLSNPVGISSHPVSFSYQKFDSTARCSALTLKGRHMANNNDEDVPFMQKLLDNHFLLLFMGVASPGVLYILWGIVDIMSVPLAK